MKETACFLLLLFHFAITPSIHAENFTTAEEAALRARTSTGLNAWEWRRLRELIYKRQREERRYKVKEQQKEVVTVKDFEGYLSELIANRHNDWGPIEIYPLLVNTSYYKSVDSSPEKVAEFLDFIKKQSDNGLTEHLLKNTKSKWIQDTFKTIDLDPSSHWNLTKLYFPLLDTFNLLRQFKESPTEGNREKLKNSYYTLLSRFGADADWYEANGIGLGKGKRMTLEQYFSSTKLPIGFASLVRELDEKDRELLRDMTNEIETQGQNKRSFARKEALKSMGYSLGVLTTLGAVGAAAGFAFNYFVEKGIPGYPLLTTIGALSMGLLPEYGFLGDPAPFSTYKYALGTGEELSIQTTYYSMGVGPRELQKKEYNLVRRILSGEDLPKTIPIREDSDTKNICINAFVDIFR